jgi:hypothetical protein
MSLTPEQFSFGKYHTLCPRHTEEAATATHPGIILCTTCDDLNDLVTIWVGPNHTESRPKPKDPPPPPKPKRKRDYREEYHQRVERAILRGLSLSQATGHPKDGEHYISDLLLRQSTPSRPIRPLPPNVVLLNDHRRRKDEERSA